MPQLIGGALRIGQTYIDSARVSMNVTLYVNTPDDPPMLLGVVGFSLN